MNFLWSGWPAQSQDRLFWHLIKANVPKEIQDEWHNYAVGVSQTHMLVLVISNGVYTVYVLKQQSFTWFTICV